MSDSPTGPETPFDSFAGRLGKALKQNAPGPAGESAAPLQSDVPGGVIGRAAQDAIQRQLQPPPGKPDTGGMIGRAAQDAVRNQSQPPSGKTDTGGMIGRGAQDAIRNQGQPAKKPGAPNVIGRAAGDALKHAQPAPSKSGTNGTPPSDDGPSPFDSFARRLDGVRKKESESAEERAASDASRPPESAGPVGGGAHVVKQGECVSSVAKNTGHFWKTIWEDAANAVLREARKDPNVLLPGDKLHVPELHRKYEPGQTEKRHRFQRRGEPAVLRLTLKIDDVPLGNQPYTLTIDGEALQGVTDPEGKLAQAIPPDARHGHLVVGEEGWEYELQLGHVDPVENLAGVQKRLNNLGFVCGRSDGIWDDLSRAALRELQKSQGLEPSGEPDLQTRQRLRSLHGS